MAVATVDRKQAICTFCGGSIVVDGDERKCMSCGREALPSAAEIAEGRKTADWTTIAISQLKSLIKQVIAVEDLRLEAERIHRALTAAEVQTIPELPWKAKPRDLPTCAKCGRKFTAGPQYRKLEDGTAICRTACSSNGTS